MAANSFKLVIIAPDKVFYDGYAEMVELNTTEGEMGILPEHIPMTVILKPGAVSIYESGSRTKNVMVSVGFAEILQDKVTILVKDADWEKTPA